MGRYDSRQRNTHYVYAAEKRRKEVKCKDNPLAGVQGEYSRRERKPGQVPITLTHLHRENVGSHLSGDHGIVCGLAACEREKRNEARVAS